MEKAPTLFLGLGLIAILGHSLSIPNQQMRYWLNNLLLLLLSPVHWSSNVQLFLLFRSTTTTGSHHLIGVNLLSINAQFQSEIIGLDTKFN
jgi:hypothetical protein